MSERVFISEIGVALRPDPGVRIKGEGKSFVIDASSLHDAEGRKAQVETTGTGGEERCRSDVVSAKVSLRLSVSGLRE